MAQCGPRAQDLDWLQEAQLVKVLLTYADEQGRIVANNPKLLKATFDMLKATHSANLMAGASAAASGFSAAAKGAGEAQSVQANARMLSFTMSSLKATTDLTKIATLTDPAAVTAFIAGTFAQKSGLLLSLAGGDSDKAKCIGAILELAGATATTWAAAPTGILLWLSLASLNASVYNMHLSCRQYYGG